MKTPWGESDDESPQGAALRWLGRYYHVLTLAVLTLFALWYRTRHWRNYVDGDAVYFRGNDPYYHLRSVEYVVHNWPQTQKFDPFTQFPFGTATAQFGTLMDQIVATVALIIGLGSPSDQLIRMVALFAPVFFGLLAIVPTYYIGRRLGGRFAGIVSVAIMVFAGGSLISQSVFGFYDHHVFEAVLQATAVLALMVAITAAEREKPVWELLEQREFRVLRKSLSWATLAGVAMGIYLWVWPPGMYFFGILAVFFAIALSADFLRGRSPEHTAIAGAVALVVAGVLFMTTVKSFDFAGTDRTILQPLAAFLVAGGCVFMAWLARAFDRRDLHRALYPATIAGIAVVGLGLLAVGAPSIYGFVTDQFTRVFGFWTPPSQLAQTVGEAQPVDNPEEFFGDYYLATIGAIAGALVILARQVLDDEPGNQGVLIVVWAAFSLASALTQQRFGYYLTIPLVTLNAALVGTVLRAVTPSSSDHDIHIESYQVFTVLAVLALLVAPLAYPYPLAMENADNRGHPANVQDVAAWDSSLEWMEENTPEPGRYGNPDGEAMDEFGLYDRTDDFDYPEGAYGVLSWWDYGHWITSEANRIPTANPFQQGASEAAEFLLSRSESEANDYLQNELAEDDAETRYVMVDWKMVETDQLPAVNGKYFAPIAFADNVSQSELYEGIVDPQALQQTGSLQAASLVQQRKQGYYETMAVRLYHYHGSSAGPQSHGIQWDTRPLELQNGEVVEFPFAPNAENERVFQMFDSVADARAFVENRTSAPEGGAQVGGIGAAPPERVEALENYRLVHTSSDFAFGTLYKGSQMGSPWTTSFQRTVQGAEMLQELQTREQFSNMSSQQLQQVALNMLFETSPMWTKTFERVPGATIEGQAPEAGNLTATVELEPPSGDSFTYSQRIRTDEDGSFTATVPYATTGYDNWGPDEGYTNTSVRATGPYNVSLPAEVTEDNQIVQHVAQVDVTEAQVIGEDDSAATAEFEEQVQDIDDLIGNGSESDGGDGTDGQDGGDGQDADDGSGSGDGSDGGDGSADGSSESRAPAAFAPEAHPAVAP